MKNIADTRPGHSDRDLPGQAALRHPKLRPQGSALLAVYVLLVAVVLAPALGATEAPRLELDAEGRLVLAGLPPILADDGVKEHLKSGLTTSIYFRPGKLAGGARVDIRYDLWDEVFVLTAAGRGERIERARASTFDQLLEWWQALRLVLLDGARLEPPWPARLRVTADVVPFSAAEQDDARRWFSESIDEQRRSGTSEVGRSGEKSSETLSRTFNLLLATSIRRRSLASYPWTLTVPPRPEDSP